MMWNGSGSAGPGGSMAEFIQSLMTQRPDLAQILAQMTRQQSSGLGQLAGGQPGGPMPMGGLWGMTGQQPTSPLPYQQRFNTTPDAPALVRMPTSYDGGRTYQMETGNTGSKFYPPSGPKQYGPTQPSYTMPTGPKSYGTPEPYTAPTGPKFYPPTGAKNYGTPTPYVAPTGAKSYGFNEAPPAFSGPSQPKVYSPQPVVGDGTVGLDWYAQQAGA